MKVMVCVASRHGATNEIAEQIGAAIGGTLEAEGVPAEVHVQPAEQVQGFDGYDAVVLGSAVYMGRWLEPLRQLVTEQSTVLQQRPVWLFSSGPVGDPPRPDEDPNDLPAMQSATNAREHRIFPGRIDRKELSLSEKMLVVALQVPDGDYRDPQAVRQWSERIARTLAVDARTVTGDRPAHEAPGGAAGPA